MAHTITSISLNAVHSTSHWQCVQSECAYVGRSVCSLTTTFTTIQQFTDTIKHNRPGDNIHIEACTHTLSSTTTNAVTYSVACMRVTYDDAQQWFVRNSLLCVQYFGCFYLVWMWMWLCADACLSFPSENSEKFHRISGVVVSVITE